MIDLKKIRFFMSVLSLVAVIMLAIIVLQPTRIQKIDIIPIRWEPPPEQVTKTPPTVGMLPERTLILPGPLNKPALEVSVRKKGAEVPQPKVEEVEEEPDLFRESVQGMLIWAFEEEFPEISLSESEYQELTDTVMTIRDSIKGLRETNRNRENALAIVQMRERLDQATNDFKKITGVHLTEFLRRAPVEGGIDHD